MSSRLGTIPGPHGKYNRDGGGVEFLADSVREILLVVFLHETLVIYEKNVGGDWYSSVSVIYHGGRIEEFYTLTKLLMYTRWLELEGILQ